MKYILYLIFFIFTGLLLFFLKNALEPDKSASIITGSEKCGECHGLKNIGNQSGIWKNSKHANAYTSLLSIKAKEFNLKNGLLLPEKEEKCLKCHTTEYFLKGTDKAKDYNINEGVGCESCHGAGSNYSPAKIMKDKGAFEREGGIRGGEQVCLKCHSSIGNKEGILKDDACPFDENDFDFKNAIEKIKHPVDKNFKYQ
ncbi:MAG: hypothetical protein IT280_08505 [Ignavibacteria bacterium]|nr:hypothetical protein [Ignavibacteria bacterium]